MFAGSGRSWTSNPTVVVTAGQVGTGFIGIQLAKVLGAGTVITPATGDGRMGSVRMSWWTTMSRTFDTLGNDTADVVFDNLGFQACGNCQGRLSSFSEIMQIVTSVVRIDVALTLSRRRSLFAPPNSCGTLVVSVHADATSLCAAGACSLSEQYHWARLRPSLQRG